MSDSRILKTLVCEHERYSELMHQIAREAYVGEYGRTLGDDVLSCCLTKAPTPDCNTPLKTAADRLFSQLQHQHHPNFAPDISQFAWAPIAKPLVAQTAGTAVSGEAVLALGTGAWVLLGLGLLVASSPAPGEPGLLQRRKTENEVWIPSVGFLPDLLDDEFFPPLEVGGAGNAALPPLDVLSPQATRQPSEAILTLARSRATLPSDEETELDALATELLRSNQLSLRALLEQHLGQTNHLHMAMRTMQLAVNVYEICAERSANIDDFETKQHSLQRLSNILSALHTFLAEQTNGGKTEAFAHDSLSSLSTFIRAAQGILDFTRIDVEAGETSSDDAHILLDALFEPAPVRMENITISSTRISREIVSKLMGYLLRGAIDVTLDTTRRVIIIHYLADRVLLNPHSFAVHHPVLHSSLAPSPTPPDEQPDPHLEAFLRVLGWGFKKISDTEVEISLGSSPYSASLPQSR